MCFGTSTTSRSSRSASILWPQKQTVDSHCHDSVLSGHYYQYNLANMSLSASQTSAMKATWGRFRDNREKIGVTVFQKLFTSRPDIQQFFPKFASVGVASLPSNGDFMTQVKLVVDKFDAVVAACDNGAALGGQLAPLAATHKGYKVTRDHLNAFAKDFVAVMVDNGISGDEKAVCEQVLNAVIDALIAAMN